MGKHPSWAEQGVPKPVWGGRDCQGGLLRGGSPEGITAGGGVRSRC